MVWHLLRVSPGAPANLACEGRVACLNGLVRGACLPRFVEAALCTHTHPAAFVAGARHVPVGRTVLAECVPLRRDALRDSTVPAGRGSRGGSRGGTAGTCGAGLVFGKTRIALLAKFWLTRAPGRAFGGRAAVARLPKSYATACDLDSAHAPLLATTHPMNCRHP